MEMKLLCLLLVTVFHYGDSAPLLNDSCYEVLEIYQMRWTIEDYYNAATEELGHIETGGFPKIENHDAYYSLGIFRDGTVETTGNFTFNVWMLESVKIEESKVAIYILDPAFDKNGKYLAHFGAEAFFCGSHDNIYSISNSIMPAEGVKPYLNSMQTLETITEITRVRVLPECQNDETPDTGRGSIIPKAEPEIVSTHCTFLSSGGRRCLPSEPYHGFQRNKVNNGTKVEHNETVAELKEQIAKLVEKLAAKSAA